MDSLLANYASSDDEQEEGGNQSKTSASLSKPASIAAQLPPLKSKPSLFSSLPPPKTYTPSSSFSSSLFSSLPPPRSQQPSQIDQNRPTEPKETKPIFSSLPPPKSQPKNPQRDTASSNPNPKRVVQFTLPLNPSILKSNGFDDEEEEEARKPIKDLSNSTSSKALSSMLPAPKNSLCLAPTVASRRAVVESNVSSSIPESIEVKQERSNLDPGDQETSTFGDYGSYQVEQGVSGYENYGSYQVEQGVSGYENYGNYDGNLAANESYNSSYGTSYGSDNGGNYGGYASNWSEGAAAVDAPVIPERIFGKRGRNEVPTEIVEVNQAELVKNRPRQDQAKLTGMAFGPAYQPVSTSKGKPSKLHKRKHQIGTLYFDMRQKEMELAERRAKGFLTKAETQAKYGW